MEIIPKTAIILAGGLGTRLRDIVQDIPKSMAAISGKPFLEYLLSFLTRQGIEKIILSVGYLNEYIKDYFGTGYGNAKICHIVENEPLGTGGALLNSLKYIDNERQVFVLNGDSFFGIDLFRLSSFHEEKKADISIALKIISRSERYGTVLIDSDNRIIGFEEKKYMDSGQISAGIYLFNADIFEGLDLPVKFSLENDFFNRNTKKKKIYGMLFDNFFIDIGVPEDYKKAGEVLTDYINL